MFNAEGRNTSSPKNACVGGYDQLRWIIFCNRCGLVPYRAQTKSEHGRYFPLGRKMFDNTTQANRNRQFGVLNKLVLINQSEFAVASVRRGEQNGVIIAGVPFLLSPIPSPFFPPSFFSFLPPPSLPPPFNACYAGYVW